jgi:hypothetical protein
MWRLATVNRVQQMKTGRDHYAEIYATQLDAEAKWLAFGAVEKANSVEKLVRSRLPHPKTLMELGAGTGAIISELKRRSFAREYLAIDYSLDACRYMRESLQGVVVRRADIITERILEKANVVVVSHVLEHLEQPEQLLRGILTNVDFDWLVIECPLEDLVASRIKNKFRNRLDNLAGHVQFFTPHSLRELVEQWVDIVDFRHYASWAPPKMVEFIAEKDHLSSRSRWIKHLTMGFLPRAMSPLWKHFWIGNYAVLCKRKG